MQTGYDVIDRLLPAYLLAVKCFRVGLCATQVNWLFFLPLSISRASKFQDAHIPEKTGALSYARVIPNITR